MGWFRSAALAGTVVVWACGGSHEGSDTPLLEGARGEYLGQRLPGDTARIFGAGLISFGTHEHHLSLSPGGDQLFYVVADRYRQHHTILFVARSGEAWLQPRVAPFSGTFNDFAPTFTPDGERLLFCSDRPLPGADPERQDVNIWVVDRRGDGWGEPRPLEGEVNDASNEYNPTVAADGTLYFQDHDESGVDLYQAVPSEGGYGLPAKVAGVNSPSLDMAPWVTPDGDVLFFSSTRPGGVGELDLWASTRTEDGGWGEPRNLGPRVNTEGSEAVLTLSPDGRFLFFTAFWPLPPERQQGLPYPELVELLRGPENADGTLYWIDASVLEDAGISKDGASNHFGGAPSPGASAPGGGSTDSPASGE